MTTFSGNDSLGAILSWRGWALHDYQATYGSRLWHVGTVAAFDNDEYTAPFKEIDGKPGGYGSISYQQDQLKLSLFYLNSNAKSHVRDSYDYAWDTDFYNISISFKQDNFNFLTQYMKGNTKMNKPVNAVNNNFTAWYTLFAYLYKKTMFSLRYDNFEVKDMDTWVGDNNNQTGTALTINMQYIFSDFVSLYLEYLQIDSKRFSLRKNRTYDPKDNLFQINFRFKF